MGTGDVGLVGLATSLLLVGVAIALSAWRGLQLERAMAWSVVRAIVQLLLVGGVLAVVIDPDRSILWSWLWVAAMLVYAGNVVRRRAPEVPRLWQLTVIAFGITTAVTLGIVFGMSIFPLEGRTVVPLAGLMIGNAMNATVLVTQRAVEVDLDPLQGVARRWILVRAAGEGEDHGDGQGEGHDVGPAGHVPGPQRQQ